VIEPVTLPVDPQRGLVDVALLELARRTAHRELRLRAAIGTDHAADFDREEHLAVVRRLLAYAGADA
jgi:hypothetical protein